MSAENSFNISKNKSNNVAIGCYGDWKATLIASALFSNNRLAFYATPQPSHRFPDDMRAYVRSLFCIRAGMLPLKIPARKPDFENHYIFSEFQRFDRTYARLLNKEVSTVIAYASMARETFKRAKKLGAKCILVLGNSHILTHKKAYEECSNGKQTIAPYYIDAQIEEYDKCDSILVESTYVKNSLISHGVSGGKIFIVPLHPHVLEKRPHPHKLIFGTIMCGHRKGTYHLMDWWRKAATEKAELWLVGAGFSQVNRLPNNVKVIGHLKKNVYQDVLSQIDVALFPTYEDGGPRSLFEAMGAGACPITSEYCAGPDHIVNGETGFVIALHNEDEWIKKIEWCIANKERVRAIGRAAQDYVKEHLPQDTYANRILSLINHVHRLVQ